MYGAFIGAINHMCDSLACMQQGTQKEYLRALVGRDKGTLFNVYMVY
jgi:hypothetical protein